MGPPDRNGERLKAGRRRYPTDIVVNLPLVEAGLPQIVT